MLKLSSQEQAIVRDILAKIIPNESVWAFGSRVSGNPKQYSDLDLVVVSTSPLDPLIMSELREAFDESNLPIQVDLIEWARVGEAFQKVIKQKHEVIQ